jgi:hypothetical protein
MANWKKVIVSGSSAQLAQLSVDTSVNITGSLSAASTVKLTGLTNASQATIVSIDAATGQLYYQGTGSFTANSASYASTASFAQSGNGSFSGSFSGSFQGDGGGLTNVPASGIVGLQLNQIGSGSVTASIAPDLGFRVNTNSQITGSLIVSSNINTAGNVVSTGAASQLTGSFTGSFAGTFEGTTNLPDLTQGAGITAFTYDGATTATVAVSGASALSANTVTKWSGDAFVNSSITDSTNVTINNAGGVLVQQGGLYVTGSSTFHDNLFVEGNLTVAGTASFQHSDNLAIADQFILLNSGSTTFQDSGFVINTGNTGNSGSAFFLETAGTTTGTASQNGRFAVAGNVQPNATAVTAEEYANTTKIAAIDPTTEVPQFGGSGLGQGNMWVNTENGDIYIYA